MAASWLHTALSAVGVGPASGSPSLPYDPRALPRSTANSSGNDIPLATTTSAATSIGNSQAAFSASNLPEHNARARIVIVGDPGTGRSTLLQLLTSADASTRLPDDLDEHSAPLRTASPLNASGAGDPGGTFTGVRLHTVASTFKSYWLELVTLPRGHFGSGARATIYSGVDGVIGLYDAAVPRTLDAMWKHVAEVLAAIGPGATILKPSEDMSTRIGSSHDAGPAVPVLVVGTKCDLVPGLAPSYSATGRQGPAHSRAASISEVVGMNEIVMSKYSPPPPELFHSFFDQVIAARYYTPPAHMQQPQQYPSYSTSTGGLSVSTAGAPISYSYGAPPSPMLSSFSSTNHAQPQASSHHSLAPPATPLLANVQTASVPTPKMHRSALLQSTAGVGSAASLVNGVGGETAGGTTPSQAQPVPARRRMVVAVGGASGAGGSRIPAAGRGSALPPSTPGH